MKYKLFICLIFFFCQISSQVQSQVTEREILTELLVGCMEEGADGITLAAQFEYCGCIASNMSMGLTHDEIMLYAAGKETSVINKKMNNFVKKCSVLMFK